MSSPGESRLWIMRHGEAAAGFPDAQRQLTAQGEQEAAVVANWLASRLAAGEFEQPRLYASPYRRAQQTGEWLAEALGVRLNTLNGITPEDAPGDVVDWLLGESGGDAPIMLVSHMPLVGELTGLLVDGPRARGLGFPTAAVAELEADVWAAGCARLRRFTDPGQLR